MTCGLATIGLLWIKLSACRTRLVAAEVRMKVQTLTGQWRREGQEY